MARSQLALGEVVGERSGRRDRRLGHRLHRQRQTANNGRLFITLKPRDDRSATASDRSSTGCARSSPRSRASALFLQPAQDINVGGRVARAQYQYTLQDADLRELNEWAPKILAKLQTLPELADVATDLQNGAPQIDTRHQSRPGRAVRHPAAADRRHALRCLRPAPGRAVLHAAQQLSRHPRGAAGHCRAIPNALDRIYLKSPLNGQPVPLSTLVTMDDLQVGPLSVIASGPVSGGDH